MKYRKLPVKVPRYEDPTGESHDARTFTKPYIPSFNQSVAK